MIQREAEDELRRLSEGFKALAVVGPRQSGKTTLVKALFGDRPYSSLENPDTRRYALEDPRGYLAQFPDGVILDEVQRTPELFSYLQQILDEMERPGRFVLTGSNHFLLQESISQSLAGRVGYQILLPFTRNELGERSPNKIDEALYKGGYPPIYDQDVDVDTWYANYLRTYIERDVRMIKGVGDLLAFERFMRLMAARVGSLYNASALAVEVGVDSKTITSWLGILESSFIIHRLRPKHVNFSKQTVKMPKVYFYDTGLACALLGIRQIDVLALHPFRGALFENWVVSEQLKRNAHLGSPRNYYFWRDRKGHEVDLIIEDGSELLPVEIKSGQTIRKEFLKGMRYWNKQVDGQGGTVIYGGEESQERSDGTVYVPWSKVTGI